MRVLLILSLLFLSACSKDGPSTPAPVTTGPTVGSALSHLDMRFLDFYELSDPTDSQTVLFRLVHDSMLYEFKNDYESTTTCRFWVTGSGADQVLNITAIPGSFHVENDTITGLGDTVMAYYFVNRLAVTDTIRIFKDNNGHRHLTASGYDVIFSKWQ
ncbi:MAG TPA: hypothetical protein VEB40_06040 [Flavipsychrobacter sp.]|nr:hypothetical protein [Flavipsychrobacter sp.]